MLCARTQCVTATKAEPGADLNPERGFTWSCEISHLVYSPGVVHCISIMELSIQHGSRIAWAFVFFCLGKKESFSRYTRKTARDFPKPQNDCSRYIAAANTIHSPYSLCFLVNTGLAAMRIIWKAKSCDLRSYPGYSRDTVLTFVLFFMTINHQQECFYWKKKKSMPSITCWLSLERWLKAILSCIFL